MWNETWLWYYLNLFYFLGKEFYPDGSYYEGTFKKGKKNGIGKLILSNGNAYEGEFSENIINGYVFDYITS